MPPKRKSKAKKEEPPPPKKEEEEEEESEDEEEEESDDEEKGRGKRRRKSSLLSAFEPEDFTMQGESNGVIIIKGRGKKLKDMPTVVDSVESYGTEDILFAHKFLYGGRGAKMTKKQMIANILDFSGYLKAVPKSYNKDQLEAEDEAEETKFSKKAFKMILSQVRTLCDFFNVERLSEDGKALNKEDAIENLLDFLSQPNKDFLSTVKEKKEAKKRQSISKAKTPTKKKPVEYANPFEIVKDHKKGKSPSDKVLRHWVKAYVTCFDMDTATTKHAIKTASDKFGVDLTSSKDRIKELLVEEM